MICFRDTRQRTYWQAVIATGVMAIVAIWLRMADTQGVSVPQCLFRRLTGIPCPGCGSIRVAQFLMNGRIAEALYLNPLIVLFYITCIVGLVLLWMDAIKGREHLRVILKTHWTKTATFIAIAVIVANWIWNIAKGV